MEGENQIFKMNIIHELKAPVLNLNMLLETLYEYDDALEVNKKREIIELGIKETKRLRKLITQFLYFREDLKVEATNIKQYSFQEAIKEIDVSKSLLFFYKNLFVSKNVHTIKGNQLVNINKDLYFNVVLNLVENASKFTYGKGWVAIDADIVISLSTETFEYKEYGRIAIIDNGVGLRARDLLSTNNKCDGSHLLSLGYEGIGLRVVRNILWFHGSLLNLVSYPERGTKFFFDSQLMYEESL